ncbi:amino acid ABC transporter substrate-binding protein [Caldisalinibacter kiritimatiensis]|uniref:Amino acid ABC transporter, amino acid-binding protein n=1 Tax=Caldisalinibacter kiritimatiensis TaxID=1304284 RepID=R1CPJ4_9FIRM|nr:amino acid ABC transporter substrate-binding protein [Caldisalinibacter kiritimatiensis]EOD00586.1 Amino acid ABC transporter, amino acid-binding protein [Caldisalinibacter kiritimatiensis]
MRKKILLVSILSIVLLIVGCSSQSNTINSLDKIKENGELIIGLDDNFPPMGFRDKEGNIVGFDIDLAKELGNRMGVKVKFKPVEWDGIVLTLVNKNIDIVWNGMTITENRKKKINFSKPYLENKQIIVVKKDSNIKSKDDLKGKSVGVQLESSSWYALNKDKQVVNNLKEIRQYPNNVEALMDLKAGRIDALVVDEILGRYYLNKNPKSYEILNDDFGKELYGIGIRKEDTKLKQEIDRILDEMKRDGTASKISEKWFGKDIILE